MKPLATLGLAALVFDLHVAQAACDVGAYTVRADGIRDNQSGLIWQRCSVGQQWQDAGGCVGAVKPLTWFDAIEQQREGWRLPTADELKTLLARSCGKASPDTFPSMDATIPEYWSSTPSGDSEAYYVNFRTGIVSVDARDEPYAVRLVRDGKGTK